jgi:tetratricopeptide (TPR) repeat protein
MPRSLFAATLALLLLALPAAASAQSAEPVRYRQSYSLEAQGDIAGALAALEQIAAKATDGYLLALRKGWLNYLAGKHAEAATAYEQAASLEPKAIEPRLGAMLPLMALRRWTEALAHGQKVIGLAPGDFTAQSRLAYIHYNQGRFDQAELWYRRALAGYPSNVEMRAGLGWSLLKQSRPKEARAEFERILRVAPDHLSAQQGMAAVP